MHGTSISSKQQKIRSYSSSNNREVCGTKSIDEYIKEFKGICDGLAAIHKPVDEDHKVINFSRGLRLKYKTFRTVILGKTTYPTLNQLVSALRVLTGRRGFKLTGHGTSSYKSRNRPSPQNGPSS